PAVQPGCAGTGTTLWGPVEHSGAVPAPEYRHHLAPVAGLAGRRTGIPGASSAGCAGAEPVDVLYRRCYQPLYFLPAGPCHHLGGNPALAPYLDSHRCQPAVLFPVAVCLPAPA